MGLRRFLPLALLIALSQQAIPARADSAASAPGWNVKELMLRLAAVKNARAHFVEHRYLRMLKRALVSSGTLVYTAPDHLEKDTLPPDAERLLVDGDTLSIERAGKDQTLQLDAYPQIAAFIEGIRGTLAGDLAALDRFYTVQLDGSAEDWQLELQPRDEKMQAIVRSVRITGSAAHVTGIDTQEADGDRSVMTITEDAR